METVFQICTVAILAVLLCATVSNRAKEIGSVLSMAVCVMILLSGARYLSPIMDFISQLRQIGNLSGDMIGILVKIVGIGMISEITCLICSDSGNGSLGKAVQIVTTVVTVWLAMPIYNALLDLIRRILEEL